MKVFYHDDNDGKAAAHMVYLYAQMMQKEISKEDFYPVNYGNKLPDKNLINKGEEVFIVDYSFTENTIDTLSAISFKSLGNVHWYDHHKSSLEVEKYVKSTNICKSVLININKSGAMIAYEQLVRGHLCYDTGEIYKVIKLVDDYDRWIHKYPESLWFNTGSITVPNGPMDDIWHTDPSAIIEKGKTIQEYKDISDTKTCKASKYFIKINDKRCIVLNTPVKSSQAFGSLYDKYKLAIRWSFNGKTYEYSVYSGYDDIDCSAIAKHFDPAGGGHKGAAGFRSKNLLIKENYSFRISMPDIPKENKNNE